MREQEDPESPKRVAGSIWRSINRSFVFLRTRAIWETRAGYTFETCLTTDRQKDTEEESNVNKNRGILTALVRELEIGELPHRRPQQIPHFPLYNPARAASSHAFT
jgi:hypothetical protein